MSRKVYQHKSSQYDWIALAHVLATVQLGKHSNQNNISGLDDDLLRTKNGYECIAMSSSSLHFLMLTSMLVSDEEGAMSQQCRLMA